MIKDGLLKNVSVLVVGTTLAQLIPIALQPVLKRVFSPEVFGVFEIYLRLLGILFVVFSLKYDMAIILPKKKWKAIALIWISLILAFSFFLICLIIVLFWGSTLSKKLGFPPDYQYVLFILPISTLFYSMYNTFNFFLIRDKKFVASGINKVNRRAIEGGFQAGSGISGVTANYGLVIGDLLGNLASSLTAYYQSFRGRMFDKRLLNKRILLRVAKEYIELPKYTFLPELLNAFFGASLSFLALSKFGINEVAFLEPTQRVLAVPSALVSVAVGHVLLQQIASMVNEKEKIGKIVLKSSLGLVLLAVLFFFIIKLFGPELFAWFLGEQWEQSGIYATYLVAFYATSFVTSPLGQTLIALKKFRVNAAWQIGKFSLIYALFLFPFTNMINFITTYCIVGAAIYILYAGIIYFNVKKYDSSVSIKR